MEHKNEKKFITLLDGESAEDYVKRMEKPSSDPRKWGSDKELTILALLLDTDIYTFMPEMPVPQWFRYPALNPDMKLATYEAIYLQNKDFHYSVVTGVQASDE